MTKDKDSTKIQYTILLPTYNESENLPIIVWLLVQYLRFVDMICLIANQILINLDNI